MADWKSALAALGATEDTSDKKEKTDIERKKRVGVVYSTNPDFEYSDVSQRNPLQYLDVWIKLRIFAHREKYKLLSTNYQVTFSEYSIR